MAGKFKIGGKLIGRDREPFLIAEAGINHNGEVDLAKRMIEAAKESGMDAVKFQTFRTEEFIQDKNEMYTYQSQGIQVTESQYEMFKRTEFAEAEWRELKRFCDKQELIFLSTPVSVRDAEFLISLGAEAIKVGSDDFINIPLLCEYAKLELPMILSSGMAEEEEMVKSLDAVGMGRENPVCLMLCTSEYPTPPQDVNARKLLAMAEKFPEVILGLSDHTRGTTAAILAVAYHACVFEKHFTLSHNLPGPDHWFSAEPEELAAWAEAIRTAYRMLGSGELKPTKQEEHMRKAARRSITLIENVKAGEVFSDKNLALLRPGSGIKPCEFWNIIGKKAARDLESGCQLRWEDIGN